MKFSSHLLLLLLGICFASNQVWGWPSQKTTYDEYNADDADNDKADYDGSEDVQAVIVTVSQEFDVNMGATVKLPCKVDPSDEVVQWTKGDKDTPLFLGSVKQTDNMRYNLDTHDHTLTIVSVNITDSDKFHCKVLDGETTSITHTLRVKSSPVITKTVPEKDRNDEKEGSPITFMCEAAGIPKPKVYWLRKNHLHEPTRVESDHFSYDKLSWKHSGNYTCVAEQDKQTVQKMIHLNVHGSPDVEVPSKQVNSAEHYESELICNIHCTGCVDIHWEKDGAEIKADRHFTILQEGHKHILRISATKKSDFGQYVCVAKNKLGTSTGVIHLKGQPMKPIFEKLTVGENGKSSIIWKIISRGEIRKYEINYKKQKDDEWQTLSPEVKPSNNGVYILTHEFDIPLDNPKDTYKARLRAQNDYGFSELSDDVPFPAGGSGIEDSPKSGSSIFEESNPSGASHLELRLSVMFTLALLTARFLQ